MMKTFVNSSSTQPVNGSGMLQSVILSPYLTLNDLPAGWAQSYAVEFSTTGTTTSCF